MGCGEGRGQRYSGRVGCGEGGSRVRAPRGGTERRRLRLLRRRPEGRLLRHLPQARGATRRETALLARGLGHSARHLLLRRRPERGLLLHLHRLAERARLHRLAHLTLLLGGLPKRARSIRWRSALSERVDRAGLLRGGGEGVHGRAVAGLLLRKCREWVRHRPFGARHASRNKPLLRRCVAPASLEGRYLLHEACCAVHRVGANAGQREKANNFLIRGAPHLLFRYRTPIGPSGWGSGHA